MRFRLFCLAAITLIGIKVMAFNPIFRGSWPGFPSGRPHSIVIANNHAYVALEFGGFAVFDLSDPANIVQIAGMGTGGWTYDIALKDSYAYVADYFVGLKIYNVANPREPFLAGSFATDEFLPRCVEVSGHFAYILSVGRIAGDVVVLDISTPSAPAFIAKIPVGATAQDLAVRGSTLYIADREGGFKAIDVADPLRYRYVTTLNAHATGIALSGDYAYVSDARVGLRIFNISNPQAPVAKGVLNPAVPAYNVAVNGSTACITDLQSSARFVDVTDSDAPRSIGVFTEVVEPIHAAISGDRAVVCDYRKGLLLLDISSISAPRLLKELATETSVRGVVVSNNVAYVTHSHRGLQILDVSDPLEISSLGSLGLPNPASVVLSFPFAYVSSGDDIAIVDVSNPASPTSLAQVNLTAGFIGAPDLSGETLYVANGVFRCSNGGCFKSAESTETSSISNRVVC